MGVKIPHTREAGERLSLSSPPEAEMKTDTLHCTVVVSGSLYSRSRIPRCVLSHLVYYSHLLQPKRQNGFESSTTFIFVGS